MKVISARMGFRKIGTDRWEFANEDFLRGKRALLKHIKRRRSSHQIQQTVGQIGSSTDMGRSVAESEVQKLKREKEFLMQEVLQLRQDQTLTVDKMDALNRRMQSAEMRQKQMVSFLAKVLQNPVFLGPLKQLKEQREIAPVRVQKKFLKQQHHNVRQIEAKQQLPDHLLLDKLGLDMGEPQVFEGTDDPEDLKGKKILSFETDAGFTGSDYIISLPDDITSEEMVSDDISPVGLSVSAGKGKEVVNFETDDTAIGTEYLSTLSQDIFQERMFPESIVPASDCVSEEGIWNAVLDAGGNSDVWDNLGRFDAHEMEVAAGTSSLWDLVLQNLEDDLDIDKYVGGESSRQDHKDEGGQLNQDYSRDLEP